MSQQELEVLTAAPVPFARDGALLMGTYEAMLARIRPHTQGVFVNGTTAEFPALDDVERVDLLGAHRHRRHRRGQAQRATQRPFPALHRPRLPRVTDLLR